MPRECKRHVDRSGSSSDLSLDAPPGTFATTTSNTMKKKKEKEFEEKEEEEKKHSRLNKSTHGPSVLLPRTEANNNYSGEEIDDHDDDDYDREEQYERQHHYKATYDKYNNNNEGEDSVEEEAVDQDILQLKGRELHTGITTLKGTMTHQEAAIERREKIIHELRSEKRQLTADLSRVREELKLIKQRMAESTMSTNYVDDKIRKEKLAAQEKVDAAIRAKESLQHALVTAESDVRLLREQLTDKDDQLKESRRLLKESEISNHALQASREEQRSQELTNRDSLLRTIEAKEKIVDELHQKEAESRSSNDYTRRQLQSQVEHIHKLQREIYDLEQKNSEMSARIKCGALVESKQLSDLASVNKRLEDEVQTLTMNNHRLLRIMSESRELSPFLQYNQPLHEFVFLGYQENEQEGNEVEGKRKKNGDLSTGGGAILATRREGIDIGALGRGEGAQALIPAATISQLRLAVEDDNAHKRYQEEAIKHLQRYSSSYTAQRQNPAAVVGKASSKSIGFGTSSSKLLPSEVRTVGISRQHEKDFWVPRAVFDVAAQFHHSHCPSLDITSSFYPFLIELNKIWNDRLQSRLRCLRESNTQTTTTAVATGNTGHVGVGVGEGHHGKIDHHHHAHQQYALCAAAQGGGPGATAGLRRPRSAADARRGEGGGRGIMTNNRDAHNSFKSHPGKRHSSADPNHLPFEDDLYNLRREMRVEKPRGAAQRLLLSYDMYAAELLRHLRNCEMMNKELQHQIHENLAHEDTDKKNVLAALFTLSDAVDRACGGLEHQVCGTCNDARVVFSDAQLPHRVKEIVMEVVQNVQQEAEGSVASLRRASESALIMCNHQPPSHRLPSSGLPPPTTTTTTTSAAAARTRPTIGAGRKMPARTFETQDEYDDYDDEDDDVPTSRHQHHHKETSSRSEETEEEEEEEEVAMLYSSKPPPPPPPPRHTATANTVRHKHQDQRHEEYTEKHYHRAHHEHRRGKDQRGN